MLLPVFCFSLGTHGQDCTSNCLCKNKSPCDNVNGTCYCAPGWTGVICDKACDSGFYGPGCTNLCQCQHGATCVPMTGACACAPGFQGQYCESTCSGMVIFTIFMPLIVITDSMYTKCLAKWDLNFVWASCKKVKRTTAMWRGMLRMFSGAKVCGQHGRNTHCRGNRQAYTNVLYRLSDAIIHCAFVTSWNVWAKLLYTLRLRT